MNGSPVTVIDTKLFGTINIETSRIEFLKTKIELSLHKTASGQWTSIEYVETKPIVEPVSESKKMRPYASQRDWDAVDQEIKKELEQEKPQGEEALNELFRGIYANASDETRRAMNKSFQTSGGTVLSTNWDEVSKKNYEEERQAPKGMEWRTWEGAKLKQIED